MKGVHDCDERDLAYLFIYFKYVIYSLMTDTQRERHRQRKTQAPCREPDAGLDPRSPGSGPGLKAALNS